MTQISRMTQRFLGLDDKSFRAVPGLNKALADTIDAYIDEHHASMGTTMTALAFVVGEMILMSGDEAEQIKQRFLNILDAYISAGMDGARTGSDKEPSLVRQVRPWSKRKGRIP
jgi:hypothetical protein